MGEGGPWILELLDAHNPNDLPGLAVVAASAIAARQGAVKGRKVKGGNGFMPMHKTIQNVYLDMECPLLLYSFTVL